MENLVYWNGEIMPGGRLGISSGDGGFLYGHGVFETMLVHRGKVVFLQEHLQRLFESLGKINIIVHSGFRDFAGSLENAVECVIEVNGLANGSLRLTVSAGDVTRLADYRPSGLKSMASGVGGVARTVDQELAQTIWSTVDGGDTSFPGRGFNTLISCKHGPKYLPGHYNKGFAVGISRIKRNQHSPLVYIKSTNYLESILAREEAVQNGWDEALFENVTGYLTEGSVSNLFLVKERVVFTPSVECGLLPGIIRGKVLKIALGLGYQTMEAHLTSSDLFAASEAFLTNSLMGVMPLVKASAQAVGSGKPGPVTGEIAGVYNEMVSGI